MDFGMMLIMAIFTEWLGQGCIFVGNTIGLDHGPNGGGGVDWYQKHIPVMRSVGLKAVEWDQLVVWSIWNVFHLRSSLELARVLPSIFSPVKRRTSTRTTKNVLLV